MDSFSTTYSELLDDVIQEGRGVAASILGGDFFVFRQTRRTNGSVFNAAPIDTAFEAKLKRTVSRDVVEGSPFEIVIFKATCDNSTLALGDVLLARGYGGDTSAYCYIQARPFQPTLFARCEQMANLSMPYNAAGTAAPPTETVGIDVFAAPVDGEYSPIVYRDGTYGFGSPGDAPATIPVGISMLNRVRGQHEGQLPDDISNANFVFFCPPLNPGAPLFLRPNTVISTPKDGNSYAVLSVYETVQGAVGSFGICVRRDV